MNVCLKLEDIQPRYIYFSNPVRNTVMENSMFMRTLYSDQLCSMSCIHIHLNFNMIKAYKYFNRYTYEFNYEDNIHGIDTLSKLEHTILDSLCLPKLTKTTRLNEHLMNDKIHIHTQSSTISTYNAILILRITGIWLTSTHCGLIYKFLHGLTVG